MSYANASILVVDDEELNRDILSRRLATEGYTVATAMGGNQAMDMLRAEPYDVVLLDIMMPGVDGYEVLRRIKTEPMLIDTPVIMVTALGDEATIKRCLELGAADYIGKPYQLPHLKSRIWRAIEALGAVRRRSAIRDGAALVLVVDDDQLNRDLLVRRLTMAGHLTHAAASGEEVLTLVDKHRYDLVLLDIMMAKMDGFTILQQIRQRPALATLPVIMVSALSDTASRARSLELGASDYITKPFNAGQLRERVLELLNNRHRDPQDLGP